MNLKNFFSRGIWPFTPDPAPAELYTFGAPLENNPILITGNSRHTLRLLRKWLTALGVQVLALNTGGLGFYSALGAGDLKREKLVAALSTCMPAPAGDRSTESGTARKAIMPYPAWQALGGENIEAIEGWEITPGPADARDLPVFLSQDNQITEEMKVWRPRYEDRLRLAKAHVGLYIIVAILPYAILGWNVLLIGLGLIIAVTCSLLIVEIMSYVPRLKSIRHRQQYELYK